MNTDDAAKTLLRKRMDEASNRQGRPAGFPEIPDLPVRRYTDPSLYREEVEHLLHRAWLFAGHVSELPEPGSYRTLDLPIAPVVLTRDREGRVRALLNTCRHRGAPVVREACGTARRLICQYQS